MQKLDNIRQIPGNYGQKPPSRVAFLLSFCIWPFFKKLSFLVISSTSRKVYFIAVRKLIRCTWIFHQWNIFDSRAFNMTNNTFSRHKRLWNIWKWLGWWNHRRFLKWLVYYLRFYYKSVTVKTLRKQIVHLGYEPD